MYFSIYLKVELTVCLDSFENIMKNIVLNSFRPKSIMGDIFDDILFVPVMKIDKEVIIKDKTNWDNITLNDLSTNLLFQTLQV